MRTKAHREIFLLVRMLVYFFSTSNFMSRHCCKSNLKLSFLMNAFLDASRSNYFLNTFPFSVCSSNMEPDERLSLLFYLLELPDVVELGSC